MAPALVWIAVRDDQAKACSAVVPVIRQGLDATADGSVGRYEPFFKFAVRDGAMHRNLEEQADVMRRQLRRVQCFENVQSPRQLIQIHGW